MNDTTKRRPSTYTAPTGERFRCSSRRRYAVCDPWQGKIGVYYRTDVLQRAMSALHTAGTLTPNAFVVDLATGETVDRRPV